MRIAIVTNCYPPRLGGLEIHVENLAHGLTDEGHEVTILTIAPDPGARVDGRVSVLTGLSHLPVADVISFPNPGTTRAITAFLRRERIELVSTHTRFFPMSYVGLRAAQRADLPVIHTEHGSGFVASSSPLIFAGSRAVDLTMGRYVLRHASRVLAVSPQAAAFAQRLGATGAQVFYNAIAAPQPRAQAPVDRPGHLVFVGRLVPGKGWDAFIDAVAALRERGLEVDGEVLGNGAQIGAARDRVRDLGLTGVVHVRGRVSQDQVRASLSGATLVNPTVLSEGFQTTLLEAVSEAGRVVTFDVPGAQLLHEQGAPVTVCPRRTTDSLVSSLAGMLASPPPPAGPRLLTPWTWPVRARQYAQIAAEVLASHRGR